MYKAILLTALLIISATSSARAGLYEIIFSTPAFSNDPNFSASGSFDYLPGTGFSNFNVIWDGSSYNFTNAANSAQNEQLDACNNTLTGAVYTFSVLTVCNTGTFTGAYNTPDIGFLFQNPPGQAYSSSSVSVGGPSHSKSIGFDGSLGVSGPSISSSDYYIGSGFSVIAVPEPSSIVLLGSGILALLGFQAMRRKQRNL